MRVVIVPGTNRTGALSLHLARAIAGDFRALGHEPDLLELRLGAEFVDPDVYHKPAPAVTALVQRFVGGDAAVFVVPEYNGSFPGILKLFIDMLPYPAGLDRRPCAFVGLASGQFQALRAVEHLQQVVGYRNAYVFPQRVFIGNAKQQFGTDGSLVDAKLAQRLRDQAQGFAAFAAAVRPPAPPP